MRLVLTAPWRLSRIAVGIEVAKACTQGLFAGWLHVGHVTSGRFATVDAFILSGGSSRSHLHDPMEKNFLPEHKGN